MSASRFLNDQALKLVQEKEAINRRLEELNQANGAMVDTLVLMKDKIIAEQKEREDLAEMVTNHVTYFNSVEKRIQLIKRISAAALAAVIGVVVWLAIK